MKRFITITLILASIFHHNANAQEHYGNTLNLGVGIGGYSGYYGYVDRSLPVLHIDYEFGVAKNFTLAPFLNFYTFTNDYYYRNDYYTYRETVMPVGVKGTYYFDDLLGAGPKWDFYLAGSLGFAIVNESWQNGYTGDRNYYGSPSPLFLDLHIGTEYHFNHRMGIFLDLSTGVSTIGLSIHKLKK
jgi:hypothetical protein